MPLLETKIDGRDAIVAYLKAAPDGGFEPVAKEDAEIIKVIFLDNGERMFLTPKPDEPEKETTDG